MSRNSQDAPLPIEKFEPPTTATVEMTEIDGMEQGAVLRFTDAGQSGHPSGDRELRTCYGDLYVIVNALRDYANMLESVIPEWGLAGYHAAVYKLHADRCREIAGKYADAIGYDYDKNVVDFESTGCDMLICDEAHYYKSLYLPTSLQVAGIPTIASQKCTDLKAKIDYLTEKNPGRNIILASGSIVSNTLAEVLVFQQYLQPERLRELGISNLSSWISRFGEISSEIEVAPQGSGFIVKSRLRRFFNVGELLRL